MPGKPHTGRLLFRSQKFPSGSRLTLGRVLPREAPFRQVGSPHQPPLQPGARVPARGGCRRRKGCAPSALPPQTLLPLPPLFPVRCSGMTTTFCVARYRLMNSSTRHPHRPLAEPSRRSENSRFKDTSLSSLIPCGVGSSARYSAIRGSRGFTIMGARADFTAEHVRPETTMPACCSGFSHTVCGRRPATLIASYYLQSLMISRSLGRDGFSIAAAAGDMSPSAHACASDHHIRLPRRHYTSLMGRAEPP